jgi:hypothetical protein
MGKKYYRHGLNIKGSLKCKHEVDFGRETQTVYIPSGELSTNNPITIDDLKTSSGDIILEFGAAVTFQAGSYFTVNVFNEYVDDKSVILTTLGFNNNDPNQFEYAINVNTIVDGGFTLYIYNIPENLSVLPELKIHFIVV